LGEVLLLLLLLLLLLAWQGVFWCAEQAQCVQVMYSGAL
jgi:hypothetical protein